MSTLTMPVMMIVIIIIIIIIIIITPVLLKVEPANAGHRNEETELVGTSEVISMSVLLIVWPKCTLAASHAAPW